MRIMAVLCSAFLISLGFYCIIRKRNMLKLIIGLNIIESGIILLLIANGYVEGGSVPIIKTGEQTRLYVDPLPQALALTGIVIGAGVTALGLSLIIRLYDQYKTLDVSEITRRLSS